MSPHHYILNERKEVIAVDLLTWGLWMQEGKHAGNSAHREPGQMKKPKAPTPKERQRILAEATALVMNCTGPIRDMEGEERIKRLQNLLLYPARTKAFIQMTQMLSFTEYSAACDELGPIGALKVVDPWKEVAMYVAIQHIIHKKEWKEKV